MHLKNYKKGYLLLEDGTKFTGELIADSFPIFGEAVFNTSHSGYQEILTDPSYHRQIMVFTAPHIGNVGINAEDYESGKIYTPGVVVRSLSRISSSWRTEGDLEKWLIDNGVPLLTDVDTRSITLHLRTRGAMRAGIFDANISVEDALQAVRSSQDMNGANLASEVTCTKEYSFNPESMNPVWHPLKSEATSLRVAVMDYGAKMNILRELVVRRCDVTVLPAVTSAKEILEAGYNGVLLSNGPGDPAAVSYAIDNIRQLIGKIPLFGICLGHQLLSLAAGMKTFKLPFGHRGANHPVRRESDSVIEITSQNHGFAVAPEGMGEDWRITHINLNDGTVEGIESVKYPAFSVQYHPEASPGPHDSLNYFDRFLEEMKNARR